MTDRHESRATTHADDCWSWGPGHYDCAIREIERLRAEVSEWKRVAAAQAELHGEAEERAERLAEALREAEKLLKRTPKATRDMYVDAGPIGWGVQAGNVLAMIRAALRDQEEG